MIPCSWRHISKAEEWRFGLVQGIYKEIIASIDFVSDAPFDRVVEELLLFRLTQRIVGKLTILYVSNPPEVGIMSLTADEEVHFWKRETQLRPSTSLVDHGFVVPSELIALFEDAVGIGQIVLE